MANEFIARKGIIALADSTISGSLSVTGTLTGDGSGLTGVVAVQAPGGSNGQIQYNDGGATGGASSFYYNDVDGRVGIGTSTPANRLHVYGGRLVIDNVTTGQSAIQINNAGAEKTVLYRPANSNDFRIYTSGGGDVVAVTNPGNVGIGINNPTVKLDVAGDLKVSDTIQLGQQQNIPSAGISHHTNGYLYIKGGTAGAVLTNDSVSSAIYVVDNGTLEFYAGSTNKMHITSAGNVGIGTTTPTYKLEVHGNTTASHRLRVVNTASGQSSVDLKNSSQETRIITSNGKPLSIYDQSLGAERFTIVSNGSVGIGATSPAQKLHVAGSIYANGGNFYTDNNGSLTAVGTLRFETFESSAYHERMRISASGNVGIGTTNPTYKLTVQGNGINLAGTGAFLRWNSGDMQIKNEGSYKMGFHTYNTTAAALVNRMVIDTDGNVGINTTTPTAKLQVQSDTADSTVFAVDGVNGRLFSIDDSLSDSLFSVNTIAGLPVIEAFADNTVVMGAYGQNDLVISGSNVGIGIDTPTDKLHIHDSTSGDTPRIHFTNSGTGTGGSDGAYVGLGNGDDLVLLNYESGGHTDFYTAGNNRMRIENTGNVGIGTTSPVLFSSGWGRVLGVSATSNYATVQIAGGNGNGGEVDLGDASVRHAAIASLAGSHLGFYTNSTNTGDSVTQRMIIKSDGNVGIGTTSPNAQLQIDTPANNQAGQGLRLSRPVAGTHYHSVEFATGTSVDWSVGQNSNDAFEVYENGAAATTRFTIKEGGNVGIGTTSPTQKLAVIGNVIAGAGANDNYFEAVHSDGSSARLHGYGLFMGRTSSYIRPTSDNTHALYIGTDGNQWSTINLDASTTILKTNGVEHMRITSGGQVGIGTTSPASGYVLDVDGKVILNQAIRVRGTETGNPVPAATDDVHLSGYGLIGNRGTVYVTNPGGTVQIGAGGGGAHNSNPVATFQVDKATFHKPVVIEGSAPNPETTDGFGLEIMGNYTDGRWNHRFVKSDEGAGVPLYVQKTTSTANVWSNSARFGSYSGNSNEFEVFGDAKVSGDFTVGGTITAQEFRAEFITNTIILESGSTQFGDSDDDTHTFTGTLTLAGSTGNATMVTTGAGDFTLTAADDIRLDAGGNDIVYRFGGTEVGRMQSANSTTDLALISSQTNRNILLLPNGTGKVGIGTQSPTQLLDIAGNTKSTNFYVDNAIYHNGDTDTYIWFTNNRIRIDVAGVTKFDSNNTYLTTTGKAADSNLLDGIDSSAFLRSDQSDTFSGTLTVDELSSIMYTPDSGFSYGVSSGTNLFGFSPFNKTWHDLLGFQFSRLTQETYDGTTWTSASLQRDLFIGKEDTSIGVITTNEGVRWTLSPAAYNFGKWLQVSYTYTSPTPTVEVIIETSPDNATWTTRGTSSNGNNSTTRFYRIDDFGGDNYIRFTLVRTSGTANVNVSTIKLWGARIGDQGEGVEQSLPYSWDAEKTITAGAFRGTGSATSYFSGNVGIGTASPSQALHVIGNGRITSDLYVGSEIFHDDDPDTKIKFDTDRVRIYAGNALKFDSNNTYLTSYTETSTLGQVLARGNSTNNTIHIYHTDRSYTFQTDAGWGGWARTPFYFEDGNGTGFGGFGAYGPSGTELNYYYIGAAYNDTVAVFDDVNNRVGIGTTAPAYTLDVAGDIRTSGDIRIADAGKGIRNATGNHIFTTGWANSLGNSALNVGDYTVMHSGYAWSGDEPSSVMTSNNYPLLVTIGANSTPFETASFYVDNSSNIVAGGNATFLGTNIYGDSTNPSVRLSNSAGAFLQYTTSNRVGVGSGVVTFTTGGGERMRITSSGNVGIGTTAPAYTLDVNGTAKANTLRVHNSDPGIHFVDSAGSTYEGMIRYRDNYLEWLWGGGMKLRVSADGGMAISQDYSTASIPAKGLILPGNVGIGLTNPAYKLQIGGNAQYIAARNDIGNTSFILGSDSNGDGNFELRDSAGTRMVKLYGEPNAANYIVNGGNFGLGTSSPVAKLHLVGTNSTNGGIRIHNAGGNPYSIWSDNDKLYISQGNGSTTAISVAYGGNVGIGTTNPGAKLDVAGQASIDADLYIGADNGANYTASRVRLYSHDNYRGAGMHMTGVDSNWFIGTPYTDFSGTFIIARKGVASSPDDTAQVSNALFTVKSTGNVGIGTTSPTYKLVVAGTSHSHNIYPAGAGVDLYSTGNYAAHYQSSFDWYTGVPGTGSFKMRLNSSGNLGIGTTSPARKLHIGGSGGSSGGIMLSPSSGDIEIQFQDSGTTNAYITLKDGTQQMRFRDDAANVLNVDFGTERVGIMTTTPQKVLDVYLGTNTAVASIGGTINSGEYAGLHFGYSETGNSNYRHSAIVFERDDSAFGDARGNIHILNSPSGSASADLGDARLTIVPSGNVGIGTTSPNSKLEVYGSGSTVLDIQGSQGQLFSVSDSLTGSLMSVNDISGLPILEVFDTDKVVMGEYGTNALVVTGSNVGIGTDAPYSLLQVGNPEQTTPAELTIASRYDGGGPMINFRTDHPNNANQWNMARIVATDDGNYNGRLEFRTTVNSGYTGTQPQVRMVIKATGNVGIGTTSPSEKLYVVGNGVFTGGLTVGDNAADTFKTQGHTYLAALGNNVGIGTTSPASKLHVEGEIRADFNGTDGSTYMTGFGIEFERGVNYLRPRGTDGTQTLHIGGANDSLDWNNVNIKTLSFTVRANGADRFQVGSDVAVVGSTDFNITGASRRLNFTSGSGTVRTTSNNALYLGTNSAVRMTITGAGNVGIGTTSPSYKLDVNGDVRFTANEIYLSGPSVTRFRSNNEVLFLTNGGSAQNSRHNGIQVSSNYSGAVPANGILFHTDNQLQRVAADQLTYSTTGGAGAFTPGANPGYFLGLDSRRWEIVFCNILDSAGLHEKNLENPEGERSVGDYATGTVLVWKGGKNVPCSVEADHMRMGIAVEGMASPLVQGAEPVLCTGVINEGDYIITSDKEGHARGISRQEMLDQNLFDCVLGKALEQGEGESYLLKVWVTI